MPVHKPKIRPRSEIEQIWRFGSGVQRMCGCKPNDRKPCKQRIVIHGDFEHPKPGDGTHADIDFGPPLNAEEENIMLKHDNRDLRRHEPTIAFEVPELRKRAAAYEAYRKTRSDKGRRGGERTQKKRRSVSEQWHSDIRTLYKTNPPQDGKGYRAEAGRLHRCGFWTVNVPSIETIRKFLPTLRTQYPHLLS